MKFLNPVVKDYHYTEKEIEGDKQMAGAIPIHKLLSSKEDKHTALENYGVPVGMYVKHEHCNQTMTGGYINPGSRIQTQSQKESRSRDISDEEFNRLFSSVGYTKSRKPSTRKTSKIRNT